MTWKSIVLFVTLTVGLLLGMTALLSIGSRPGQATDSSPRAVATTTMSDVGTMKVSDIRQADFTINNEGKEPLTISNMNSSCGCIVGQFIYKDTTSAEYGMHAQSGFLGRIQPGDSATIRAIYRPSVMPVYGPVERSVTVETNDPLNPKLTFTVAARVE